MPWGPVVIDLSTVRLAIICPTQRGVHSATVMSFLQIAEQLGRRLALLWVNFPATTSCAVGRGRGVQQVLDSPLGFTHMLALDDDVSTSAEVIERLLTTDAPIVGANYRRRTDDLAVVDYAVRLRPEHFQQVPRPDGTIAVDAVPGGLCLWRRDALEQLDAAHPRVEIGPGARIASFFLEQIVDGEMFTEDFAACRRWRRLGGEVRMLLDADVTHNEGGRRWPGNFNRDLWARHVQRGAT
jgi:hypothetical protein